MPPFPPSVTYENVRFMFDGGRIMETATPEEVSRGEEGEERLQLAPPVAWSQPRAPPPFLPSQLGLESGDQIDAMVEQLGGC